MKRASSVYDLREKCKRGFCCVLNINTRLPYRSFAGWVMQYNNITCNFVLLHHLSARCDVDVETLFAVDAMGAFEMCSVST